MVLSYGIKGGSELAAVCFTSHAVKSFRIWMQEPCGGLRLGLKNIREESSAPGNHHTKAKRIDEFRPGNQGETQPARVVRPLFSHEEPFPFRWGRKTS